MAVTKLTHEDGMQYNDHKGFTRLVFLAVCITPLKEPGVHEAPACERACVNFAYDAVRIEVGLSHSHIAVNKDCRIDTAT
jgi:hypothetical protein